MHCHTTSAEKWVTRGPKDVRKKGNNVSAALMTETEVVRFTCVFSASWRCEEKRSWMKVGGPETSETPTLTCCLSKCTLHYQTPSCHCGDLLLLVLTNSICLIPFLLFNYFWRNTGNIIFTHSSLSHMHPNRRVD